jgi:putative ABC transport system permease protein
VIAALDRKLFRDLWHVRGQALAIAAVIASGVALFVTELSTQASLALTRSDYYAQYRFAEVFARCKRAPNSLRERIAEIPGVDTVQTRVVSEVTLDVPGLAEPAVGKLVSIPRSRRPDLNDVFLRSGRYIEPTDRDAVLASEGFVLAHKMQPGDKVAAVINGRRRELTIVGVALSPEFIYSIRDGDFLPDDKRFGVFWMSEDELASAFDMQSAFNDVSLTLEGNANSLEVLERLDKILEPYGGVGAIERKHQVSHWYLENELTQLKNVGIAMPLVFLAVAAFLLNVVLTRLIATQREQIAALKAFGYSNLGVGWHYTKFVLLIVALGAGVGAVSGAWLGTKLTALYTEFYRFPFLRFTLDPTVVLSAIGITAAASLLGALGAVRSAVILPPAEAMRPPSPGKYRPMIFERMGLQKLFPQTTRMILRQFERRPYKTGLSVLGIAMGVAVFVVGFFFIDTIDYVMDAQFSRMERQDVTVSFTQPRSARALHEIESLPGVLHAEAFRAVPATFRFENKSRQLAIMGVPDNPQLKRVLDAKFKPIDLPADGLAMSRKLAEVLGLKAGQRVTVEIKEGARPTRQIVVSALIEDFLGMSAYMRMDALNSLMREGPTASGAYLSIDTAQSDELYARLKRTPGVAAVTVKSAALKSFQDTLAQSLLIMVFLNVGFASVIAFGVVYNTARVSLSERGRELASLRVLGLTRSEISFILLGELAIVTLLAIPLGCVIGYFLASGLIRFLADFELIRFPLVISSRTYGWGALVVMISAAVSALIVRRRLDHLDLVEVLKTRE